MKNFIYISLLIVSVFSSKCYAQKVANAEKKYDNYAYVDAIKTYERIANKGYKSTEIFKNLGNAYYFNGELDQAAKWYTELFSISSDFGTEYYYRYAQSLRSIGDNAKANKILEKLNSTNNDDIRLALFLKNKNYLEDIKANSGRYKIEDAGINSIYSDYGTTIYNNQIVFTSARDTGSLGQRKHTWTNQHFTNLYSANLTEDMTPESPVKFDQNIKSKFNESTPIFTKDGRTIYFTRNNYLEGKRGRNSEGITLIKIYKAKLINNVWSNIEELPFNSDNYSTAHPALSADEKTLYFASDMPGTLGQSDLFKVSINEDGTYTTPQNLGPKINTEGRETFPFLNDENEIYFASDGHPGLGGLDVFMSKIDSKGSFTEVINLGAEINSPKDDFAYIIDTKSRVGFFTSNKDGGLGYDDIYKFTETKKLICEQLLNGQVTDLITNEILPNTKVSLLDKELNLIGEVISDAKGFYSFTVECGKTYSIRIQKPEYSSKEEKVIIPKVSGTTYKPTTLEKVGCNVVVGDDLGKCFGITMIYFDLDKSNIRREAALDLEKILDVLKENPNMEIDVRSHTDSRQTFKYNEALSDRRAKSTISWLIKNGIDAKRLTGKGYGESQLINKCADGVECTEEEHQRNRRSEFIITKL
ncbi:OmpA family protein [Flavobacterium sp. F-380]|uniref:OmpA family protein n=1 Tax=Flavobacterium kayseriense TaxID=2764714 RepID=A0ABR7JB16_9FLAO|nr:OmpA family protein [Flavobacterium kayseriense]MBC5842392.1 OmpA family protein [Flavobacterium kayseriense]MBC5848922.1 OmpA family protein [Flavobacterium kayseriense]